MHCAARLQCMTRYFHEHYELVPDDDGSGLYARVSTDPTRRIEVLTRSALLERINAALRAALHEPVTYRSREWREFSRTCLGTTTTTCLAALSAQNTTHLACGMSGIVPPPRARNLRLMVLK